MSTTDTKLQSDPLLQQVLSDLQTIHIDAGRVAEEYRANLILEQRRFFHGSSRRYHSTRNRQERSMTYYLSGGVRC